MESVIQTYERSTAGQGSWKDTTASHLRRNYLDEDPDQNDPQFHRSLDERKSSDDNARFVAWKAKLRHETTSYSALFKVLSRA